MGVGNFTWKKFAAAVNDAILKNCNDGTAAEDKQLGAFFVKANDVKDTERFAEKVLMYLWDDVAKYDKAQLFDTNNYRTLDEVIEGFAKGENVFSPNCTELKSLYDSYEKMKQPEQADENTADVSSGADPGTGAPEATDEK